MKAMSTPYETGGRSGQKARTRDALVAAARDLVAAGGTPTVEDAAAAASISRSTATATSRASGRCCSRRIPKIAATSMLPANPPQDPAARLDAVVRNFTAMILDTEAQQRTMLRLSLEADAAERDALPLRQGRAIAWIAEAIDGVRGDLSDQQFRQLVLSIRATIGIEAIVWLVDVAACHGTMPWPSRAGPRRHSCNGQPRFRPRHPADPAGRTAPEGKDRPSQQHPGGTEIYPSLTPGQQATSHWPTWRVAVLAKTPVRSFRPWGRLSAEWRSLPSRRSGAQAVCR